MRILGIDPGTISAGYGVIEKEGSRLRALAYGSVRAASSMAFAERLKRIFEGLRAVIEEWRPDEAAVESLFGGKSIRSALAAGEGRGVAVLAVALAEIPLAQYAPAEIKKAVVGQGRAAKVQVQKMVQVLLALPAPPKSSDAADALAVALCHCQRRRPEARLHRIGD